MEGWPLNISNISSRAFALFVPPFVEVTYVR
jgi:hypothetical protein